MNLSLPQQKTKQALYSFWKQGGNNAIVYGPPRFGKTVIFSDITKDFTRHNRKVLIILDRYELQGQAGGTLDNFDIDYFYISAGCKTIPKAMNCFVAMSQTLRTNRINELYWRDLFENFFDLILIDEVHVQEFNWLFSNDLNLKARVAGFTGTPKRTGKMRQLGVDFETIIQETSPSELLASGDIVQADIYQPSTIDASGVQVDQKRGDYNLSQLYNKFDNRELYAGVVENYQKICPGTKFICYCVNKIHAIKTAIEFHQAGIQVKFVVSNFTKPKPPKNPEDKSAAAKYEQKLEDYNLYKKWFNLISGDREQIFDDFKHSRITGLINVEIATKGFDCPDIETVILNYKTLSATKYLQSALRGSTGIEGKTHFNLLDFGGNVSEFGDPLKDREWYLWHEPGGGDGLPPMKECGYDSSGQITGKHGKKGCRRLIPASMTICPFDDCGFEYPPKKQKTIDLVTLWGEQQEADKVLAKKTKLVKDMTFDELVEYKWAKGHKDQWLWRQLWYRGKEKALWQFGKRHNWSSGTIKKAIVFCKKMKKS